MYEDQDPHESLAHAVIRAALEDAADDGGKWQEDALLFLFAPECREARGVWCRLIDVDEATLQNYARMRLAEGVRHIRRIVTKKPTSMEALI